MTAIEANHPAFVMIHRYRITMDAVESKGMKSEFEGLREWNKR